MEDSIKEFNKFEILKTKIENEMIKIDKLYENIFTEVTKTYELKHEKLTKEENELKEKLKIEVTKTKEKLELNLSEINDITRKCERIIKYVNKFKEEENNNVIKELNYISNIDKNAKEMSLFYHRFMKSLDITFNDNNIKYEEYYFNGMPIPKDVKFSDIRGNSLKISWNIDNFKIIGIDNEYSK